MLVRETNRDTDETNEGARHKAGIEKGPGAKQWLAEEDEEDRERSATKKKVT